jgi:hypothetical protein
VGTKITQQQSRAAENDFFLMVALLYSRYFKIACDRYHQCIITAIPMANIEERSGKHTFVLGLGAADTGDDSNELGKIIEAGAPLVAPIGAGLLVEMLAGIPE